jgi:RNA recognition motif-containing protein
LAEDFSGLFEWFCIARFPIRFEYCVFVIKIMDIYVGNLPYTATEANLTEIFAQFEPKSVKIITDRESGQSKGFAFLTLTDDSRVNDAVAFGNGRDFEGRSLIVNPSEGKKSSKGGFGSGSYNGGGGGGNRSFGGGGGGGGGNRNSGGGAKRAYSGSF